MQLQYSVSLQDFRALQHPFEGKAGNNAGFKAALVACALIAALGVFCLAEGLGMEVGDFLIGLGFLAAAAMYFLDMNSVRKAKNKYEKNIAMGYARVHCRDRRIIETGENGFTASCKCGTVTFPWSELALVSENETHFCVATKAAKVIVPKSAFAAPSDVTEFRAAFAEKLNQDRPLTARRFEFACNRQDFRRAYWLNVWKGGGWKRLLKMLATYACVVGGVYAIYNSLAAHKPAIVCGLVGVVIGMPLIKAISRRREKYFGKTQVQYSDEGIHIQDAYGQVRRSWSDYIGFLEDENILLLYRSQLVYRLIPKRALVGRAAEFKALAMAKIAPYDYDEPTPKAAAAPA